MGWAVTSHHLSKYMHHEPSGLGPQGSILALFHVSRVILDELTPYHRLLICLDIYPEDVFPLPPFLWANFHLFSLFLLQT